MTNRRNPPAALPDVRPMTAHIGAEIAGVDLSRPLPGDVVTAIREALVEWKVIFFRNQSLDHAQHSRFARQFGELTPAHVVFGTKDGLPPEIYPITKFRVAIARGGEKPRRAWKGWHADVTPAVNPPFATILRGDVIPPHGGDTLWLDMTRAYETLSPVLRGFIDHLSCIHRFEPPSGADRSREYDQRVESAALMAEHPMVVVHPESGRRVLYVNPEFVRNVVGLSAFESERLLELLYEHALRPEFMVRFRWEPGSVAFWDNRSCLHFATPDIFDLDFDRRLYRVTLMGEPRRGIDGTLSRLLSGSPIAALGAD